MLLIYSVNNNNFFFTQIGRILCLKRCFYGDFLFTTLSSSSYNILVEVYGEYALAERTCQNWFARFKNVDFGLEDEERSGQPKKFEDAELEARLEEDPCQR